MRNLWVFGDSFADENDNNAINKLIWTRKIANDLECNLNSFGKYGTAIEYSVQQYLKVRNDIQQNDVVIFVTTNPYRVWWDKKNPNATTPLLHKQWTADYTKEDEKYVERLYLQSLERIDLKLDLLELLYNDLHSLAAQHEVNAVVLNAFNIPLIETRPALSKPQITTGNKPLKDISAEEIQPPVQNLEKDFRPLHFSEANHEILANKITEAINKKECIIDLKTGFIKGIYTPATFIKTQKEIK